MHTVPVVPSSVPKRKGLHQDSSVRQLTSENGKWENFNNDQAELGFVLRTESNEENSTESSSSVY
jgi:hypothetical protein